IVQESAIAPVDAALPTLRWGAATDLGIEYIGKPAIGADQNGEVVVSVLERTGGPLWLVENGQATKLEAHAASLPAMRFLHGTLYVVARSAGQLQTYQVLARNNGVWATAAALGELPLDGGGPFGGGSFGLDTQKPGVLAATAKPVAAAPAAAVAH
ncbi:MAG TPA: PIG-L family deacetylase, partial [Bordetella sp.]|nr:PIG-L family deacetylase [Bordetella sp.]